MNHDKRKQAELELEPLKQESGPGKEPDCKEFDDILNIVGTQGKFQRFLLYGVICPITALEPFFTLNSIFMIYEPDHWCHVPGRNDTSLDLWKNLTLPIVLGPDGHPRYSQCSMYDGLGGEIECNNGWEYDRTDYETTIPTDYNWFCTKSHYTIDSFTVAAVGNAVGTIIFGQAADIYGRKPIFFLTFFINIFFRFVSLFVPNYISVFLFMQFMVGSAFPAMFIAPSMIVAEVCDKDYRAWVYAITWMIWVAGMAALPLLAWACRDWFVLGMVTSIPGFLLFVYYGIMPESPRWLVSRGRMDEAAKIVLDIAKQNGTEEKIPPAKLDAMLLQLGREQAESKKVGVWTLFSRSRLAKNTIMLTLSWSMNIMVYYGITLNTTQMAGNQFVNFFILSIVELPAGYFGGILVDKVGRRWTQVAFFLACALTCFAAGMGVYYPDFYYFNTSCVISAKFAITLTFLVVYLQGTEIFPTQLRSTGSGFASTIGSAMGIMGPSIVSLGKYHLGAPYYTMGGLSILGMIASAFLPETLYQNLPETVEDANNFGKGNKFWAILPETKKGDKEKENKWNPN